jgi:hypothetical protein
MPKINTVASFWSTIDRNGPIPAYAPNLGPCWIWKGYIHPSGYGRLMYQSRYVQSHIFAYQLTVGPIPNGLHLDHLCRVRACANPTHLEPVTSAENSRRGSLAYTHCRRAGHEFTPDNIKLVNGHRTCWTCGNEVRAAWKRRKRRERGLIEPPRGEAHPNARLTEARVREIRADSGTCTALGEKYGVSRSTIDLVRRRKVWAWLI